MGIPAVRVRLLELADALILTDISRADAAGVILDLIPHMVRNKFFDTDRRIHFSVTFSMAIDCWRLHRAGWTCHEIGERLGIDGGRVSEVLHGLRFPEAEKE